MDIAKIRKKAKAQAEGRAADAAPSAETEQRPAPALTVEDNAETNGDAPVAESSASGQPLDQETAAATAGPGYEADDEDSGNITELLTFSLAREEFAFRVSEVEEIIRFQRITVVPNVPRYVAGVTSLRGKIIPVIDLRARLELGEEGDTPAVFEEVSEENGVGRGKIIILGGPLGLIGAIIDQVMGVVRLPADYILEPPAHLSESETRYIEGVVIVDKRFISIVRSDDALTIEVG